MTAYRYNWDTDVEEQITIPDTWNCPLGPAGYDTAINCASCGKPITYGKSYTSIEIENKIGLGYWVCGKCHWEEIDRRRLR